MAEILVKIGAQLLWNLLTYNFIGRLLIEVLREAAKLSSNDVDDKIVNDMEKALFPPKV